MTPRRDLTPAEIREMVSCMAVADMVRREGTDCFGFVGPYYDYVNALVAGRWTWA